MEPDRVAGVDPYRFHLYCLPDFGPTPDPESDDRTIPFIKDRLGELAESGRLTEYVKRTIEEMSGKVLEHIARKHDRVREGVRSVMGGKVLEYEAKTILNEGIVLGRTETARRMLVLNFTPEQISQATELSLDEIEGLKQANDFRGLR